MPTGRRAGQISDPPSFHLWPPLAIFLAFALAVGLTGYVVYRGMAKATRQNAEHSLRAVADLKVQQVGDWLDERRKNAERASRSLVMAPEIEQWLARGAPPADETAKQLIILFQDMRVTHHWDRVFLVDRKGEVRLHAGERKSQSPESRRLALESMENRQVALWDLHREPGASPSGIRFGFFAPLLVQENSEKRAIGAIAMEMDPAGHLFPLIESWPLPSRSGESMLLRREGSSVLYISELRHRPGEKLSVRLPAAKDLVAARAVRGEIGPMTGRDYRGTMVLACTRPVRNSPWLLVAKVDVDEINAPVAKSARLVALFGLVLLLAAGLTTAFWLRQQRATALVRYVTAEREWTALTKHLDYLTRYANDIILLVDKEGRITDANERAVEAYGYPRDELIGADIRSIRAPEDLLSFERHWARSGLEGGVVFETVHQRKDGTTFPAEVSTRAIDVDGITLRQSIVRDITERKDAEKRIVKLGNLYNALSQMNQAIVRGNEREELFSEICRVSVEYGRLEFAWVGLGERDGSVRLAARHGRAEGFLEHPEIVAALADPEGLAPARAAIQARRSYISNDFFADPGTLKVRNAAALAGFNSAAVFPLASGQKVIGFLAVYATERGFFDEQTITLLEEMTDDVSFALDGFKREERRRAAEAALRESEEKYRLLFSNEQDAIHIFDAETGRIIEANAAFAAMSGYSAEETVGMRVPDFSAEPEATQASLARVREKGSEHVAQRRFRRKDGTLIWVEIVLSSFVWRGRRLVAAILRDITERRKAQERSLLWTKVLENSAEAIIVTDAEANIVDVNKAFTAVTGYTPQEAIGSNPRMLSSGRQDAAFYHVMWRTIRESGRWQGEIWNRRRNGEIYPCWLSITAVRDANGELTHYVGISSDITERKETADRIHFLANHDSLTGLPNRSLMNDLIQQSAAIAKRKGSILALLFLDLDHFKTINDSLGHPVGDALLQHVAARLKKTIREGDSVGRLGGDEFLVLLPELSRSEDAAVVAEKIIAGMREPIAVEGHRLAITASIGISVYPADGAEATALIRNADAAMYHAKERGRNTYQFFTADMNARAFEALAMEMSLRGGLERNEFSLWYQPQIETANGRIIAAEALVRWHHPDLGVVAPGRFIPVAEEHGLIVPIGDWVLRTACTQVRAWLDEGIAVRVAVNVSPVQFRQPGLAARVGAILGEVGIDPRYLELELTESVIMRDAEQTISVLEELSRMGVSLSIDDFGTGYSSLSYLRRFPIDRLKIDQSFVHDISTNPDAAAIAAAIIGMGRSLKLRVIAEGVETPEQYAFLAAQQCDELQGFHIGPPMRASEFAALLRERRPLLATARS
jgi:diguanylate cyclase (GGDEF)-like protein/PAS domain S-box-containing protein